MNIYYLSEDALLELKSNINNNIWNYSMDEQWLDEFFSNNSNWRHQSKLQTNEIQLKIPSSKRITYDSENAITLHSNLPLNSYQALDERMWAYFAHYEFWKYTQSRWGATSEADSVQRIKTRYFFDGTSRFSRSSLARLWWAAEVTQRIDLDDSYALTKILFLSSDLQQGVIERNFSHNLRSLQAILMIFKELFDMDEMSAFKGAFIQKVLKEINGDGGVTLIDTWDLDKFRSLIYESFDQYIANL